MNRQRQLLEHLSATGAATYEALAAVLGSSTMTARRCVDSLAKQGRVIKTLGGAQLAAQPSLLESSLQHRLDENKAEKRAIAAAALSVLGDARKTVFVDGGTTCLELARLISRKSKGLTVVTNSALISLEAGCAADNMIVGIGGQLDPQGACFVGPSAEEFASRFFVDVAFISTKGFIAQEGTFESAMATFRIKQIIAKQAAKVVLLIDHSKFGQRALCRVLPIEQIHTIVTDPHAPADDLAWLRESGKEVIVAPTIAAGARREVADAS